MKILPIPNLPDRIVNIDDNIKRLTWIDENCLFHRIDGPAVIELNFTGNVIYEAWWINGIPMTDIKEWLKENNIGEPYSEEDQMAIILRWG